MDVIYIEQMIATLETKRTEHCCEKHQKQAGGGCIERFSRMIDGLKEKLSIPKPTAEPVVTARGDELQKAGKLSEKADKLEQANKHDAAEEVKNKARKIVAKELNEMDGFPR
jgi:hypothetical protein